MPLFILLCLSLSYLVYHNNPLLNYLLHPSVIPIAGSILAISGLALLWEKTLPVNWHEIFISSALLVWFSYWRQFFQPEAPMFFYFPVFLALVTTLIHVFLIKQRHNFDEDTIRFMQHLETNSKLPPVVVMGLVIASFFLREHYLLFPITLTVFLFKYALQMCLKK